MSEPKKLVWRFYLSDSRILARHTCVQTCRIWKQIYKQLMWLTDERYERKR